MSAESQTKAVADAPARCWCSFPRLRAAARPRLPAIAGGPAGDDPRRHLHHARAARRRARRRGLLFPGRGSFLKRVQAGNFLEHATVYGNSYGTLKAEVLGKLRQGKDVLLNVDVQGAATIREKAQEDPELKRALVSVFLTPPSLDVLEERLRKRGTDSQAVIQKRLGVARQEIAQWKNFDYLLLSTTIQEDLRRMLAIVEAEKMRTVRVQAPECVQRERAT